MLGSRHMIQVDFTLVTECLSNRCKKRKFMSCGCTGSVNLNQTNCSGYRRCRNFCERWCSVVSNNCHIFLEGNPIMGFLEQVLYHLRHSSGIAILWRLNITVYLQGSLCGWLIVGFGFSVSRDYPPRILFLSTGLLLIEFSPE